MKTTKAQRERWSRELEQSGRIEDNTRIAMTRLLDDVTTLVAALKTTRKALQRVAIWFDCQSAHENDGDRGRCPRCVAEDMTRKALASTAALVEQGE